MTILHNDGSGWSTPVGITEGELTPAVELSQNVPNPFNPLTHVRFTVPESTRARLSIYSVDGRFVATILDRVVAAGTTGVDWNGVDGFGHPVASGVYFYRLSTPGFAQTRKMVLLR